MNSLNGELIHILLLGGILFIGLFNIVIHYVRRSLKVHYYFGLVCVCYFVWYSCNVINYDVLSLQQVSDHHRQLISAISTNRMSLYFILYMSLILKLENPLVEKYIRLGANLLLGVGLMGFLFEDFSSKAILAIQLFNMVIQLYLGYEAFKKIRLVYRDVRLINAIASIVVCITGVMELTEIPFYENTILIAFVLIGSQAVILAMHYNHLLVEASQTNATLEKMVAERTADLVGKEEETIQLVLSISHDLRTPISVVGGYMELLQNDKEIQDKHRNYLEKSTVRLWQMEKLTIDLFTMSQLRSKSLTIQRKRIDLALITRQVVELYEEQSSRKKVRLYMEGVSEAWCIADETRVIQILDNLLINALAYARTSIVVRVLIEEDVLVQIIDDGTGIPPDEIPFVFERFYKKRKRGFGIGLSNVKELVERMDGSVSVYSIPGTETSFMFQLPLTNRSV